MIIQPGTEQPAVANMIELARVGGKRRVNVELRNESGDLVDIDATMALTGEPNGEFDVQVTNVGGYPLYTEAFFPDPPPLPRLTHRGTGLYDLTWGEGSETSCPGTYLFNWHSRQNGSSEDVYRTQVMEIISPRVLSLLPSLRLMLDKVVKSNYPAKGCYLGFTDGMLLIYLRLGLALISEAQPYPSWCRLDDFPLETFSNILLKAAIYQGVTSQLMFAIDTDVPSFSDSGHSFVLQHAGPLSAYLSHLKQELDAAIPHFKRHFVNSGTLGAEVRMDQAWAAMLSAAPSGSLFKSLWTGGPL
jgi:hypothetical protein